MYFCSFFERESGRRWLLGRFLSVISLAISHNLASPLVLVLRKEEGLSTLVRSSIVSTRKRKAL
jgi:hypothetical protein